MGDPKYKIRHKKLGLCVECSRVAEAAKVRCKHHAKVHRDNNYEKNKIRKEKCKVAEKCTRCHAPLEKGESFLQCYNCRHHLFSKFK
jgi:hypothetical protein